jgi:hypothetical protein
MLRLALALSVSALLLPAQNLEMWPGAQYDPAIPTMEKALGFSVGEKHATHADIVRYFEALAAAAPSRMKLFDYGKSWEDRKLFYAVIASETNLKKLDQIKAGQQKLADARKTPANEAKSIAASAPVVLSLLYGVHGNEISSPDSALFLAYHLLASRNDKLVAATLQNVVVLIDPIQNPDGRERFIHNYRVNHGLEPDPSPTAAERAEPWPGGRSNHYLFDMNRDWFAMTQPETRGRIKFLLEWLPQVQVDLHEMGSESTYFFAPGSAPYNPHLTPKQKEQMYLFGKNNAKWFDQFGYPYFTREVFDEFYPGYGASWPWYYGGFGMTYENASVRGLVYERRDGTLYGYRDSVRKHFLAAVSTCETAAANRAALLENFHEYSRTAVEEGKTEAVKEYLLPREGDVSAVDKLAGLLVEQGIEVRRASAAFQSGSRQIPAGSYSVLAAQPRKRFIRTLLDAQTSLDPEFIAEQERRRKRRLPDQIYDVTGWSLPLLYNVECLPLQQVSAGAFEPLTSASLPKAAAPSKAEVAYVIPWGTQAAGRFLAGALRADLRVLSVGKPFQQAARKYPAGTLVVMVRQNPASVHETVARLTSASGAEVVPVNSSWVDDGIDFGSNSSSVVRKPGIALLWDTPTSSLNAGATRFVIERQYGYPVSVIRASSLATADLSRYSVLIMPDTGFGSYAQQLGGAADRLKAWVRSGGTIVAVGNAINYLSGPQLGLLNLQQERLVREGAAPTAGGRPAEPAKPAAGGAPAASGPVAGKLLTKPEDLEKLTAAENAMPDSVAGVLVRANVDREQWITAGLPPTLHVMVNGRSIYSPLREDQGINAITYAAPGQLVASGYMWEENRKQLAFKPFVAVQSEGRGNVVAFTADPNYRAFMDGLNVVFLNAIFRAPGGGLRGGAAEELR